MDGIKLRLKRAKNYLDASGKPISGIADYKLEYGEPLYLEDLDILLIGDGQEVEVETDKGTVTQYVVSTVQELIDAKNYFAKVSDSKLFKQAEFQYQEYEDGKWVNKDIPITSNDNTIANTKFVQDLIKTLDVNKINFEDTQTIKSISETDGKINVEAQEIHVNFANINGAEPSDSNPKEDKSASAGTSNDWSRADHVHPHDSTKADKTQTVANVVYTPTGSTKGLLCLMANGKMGQKIVDIATLKTDMSLNNVPNESKTTLLNNAKLTGNPTAPDINNPANSSYIATKNYVESVVKAKSVVEDKNVLNSGIIYVTGVKGTGPSQLYYNLNNSSTSLNPEGVRIDCTKGVLMGAAWNDFAEYRRCQGAPGTVVCETGKGDLLISSERLQPGAYVISDTYGMVIGDDSEGNLPVAVAGRVLALYGGDSREFKPGMPVCAGPFGRIYAMTREEIKEYPEAIVGYVSEIPDYEEWNGVKIAKRIWIKVK